eukprot:364792-Chlamydomonas_euryale.AAC.24
MPLCVDQSMHILESNLDAISLLTVCVNGLDMPTPASVENSVRILATPPTGLVVVARVDCYGVWTARLSNKDKEYLDTQVTENALLDYGLAESRSG